MKQIKLSFCIPTSWFDIKTLWKEYTSKRYNHNKQVILTLYRGIIAQAQSGYWSHDVTDYFRENFEDSLDVQKCLEKALKELR